MHPEQHPVVFARIAEAVDAGDTRHDDDIPPLKERARGGHAQPVNVLVDDGLLLNVRVGRRDVGLRLIVVVVAHEVFDGVVGEELLELLVELRGERLIVRHHEDGPIHLLDHLRDRERLPRARDAHEDLEPLPLAHAAHKRFDRLRLIPPRLILGDQGERHSALSPNAEL